MKNLLLLSALFITLSAKSQGVSLQAGAGFKQSLAGHLAVSYQIKNIEASTTMLSLPFRKATFFTESIGYVFHSNDWQVKPYLGYAYKMTGNHNTQDTYVKDGVVTVLASNQEVNQWYGAFGILAVKGVVFGDFNYTNGFSVSIGLRYTFN